MSGTEGDFKQALAGGSQGMPMKVSMVIPCFNSEKTIQDVVARISGIFGQLGCQHEIILVNDCSKDRTWEAIRQLCEGHENMTGIDLAKNAGQHGAVMAGLRRVSGDIVMSCDDDGQTPVEQIPCLIRKLLDEGLDVACAKYTESGNKGAVRRIGTAMNRAMADWLIGKPPGIHACLFMAARRYIIDEVCRYQQPYPYIGGLIFRATHNVGNVEMVQHGRKSGASGYSFMKLLQLWLNGFTAFSVKPLRVSSLLGLLSAASGFLGSIAIIARKLAMPSIQAGWSSMAAIILFMSGIILIVLGIIGEYVGRIYMCINNTPQYVEKEVLTSRKKIGE